MLERWGWKYALVALGSWIFAPELRRMVDYASHFSAFSIVQILPLLLLLPFAWWMVREGWRETNPTLRIFAGIWFAAFIYGAFIGAAHGVLSAAIYGVAQFCLPVTMAMWFASRPEGVEKTYARITYFLVACAGVSSIYGILQYLGPSPWDAQWQLNTDAASFGDPVPFQIRVYSTMNSPGLFGTAIATIMIMALPLLRERKLWVNVSLALCVAALALSLVRSAWLALALAIVVYALLAPQRARLVATLAGLAVLVVASGALLFAFAPNDEARLTLSDRFSTLFDLQDDGSAAERQVSTQLALQNAMANPLGGGVGTTGVGARLVTSGGDLVGEGAIDNGYASRFVEMGYVGMLGFVVVLFGGVLVSFGAWREAAVRKMNQPAAMIAAIVALQAAMLFFNVAGDVQQGLVGVLFWTSLGLATRWAADAPPVRAARLSQHVTC